MCLQYPSAHVACVCIHIACKWSDLEIPRSSEGKEWFQYTDKDMTYELLEELTSDFLSVLDKCPSKLKKKILTWKKDGASGASVGAGGSGGSNEVDGPPTKKVRHEASAAAGSAAQAGGHRPPDAQRMRLDHRAEPHHDMKQRPPGSYNAARHDPSRVKIEPGHHGPRLDHHNVKRESGYHEKREPGYHDPAKRDPNLHHVKLENPASRHPHALAPQEAGMRRIKTEPSLTLTHKEYMERREKEKALQAQHQRPHRAGEPPRPSDPFKAPVSSDRHHLDSMARMKERPGHHGAPPGSEQHRKEQHRQRPMPLKPDQKPRLTSPPPNSVKAQSNMSDMLEREIQRQQQNLHKSHGGSTHPAPPVTDAFRSQHEQKPRPPAKERDGVFSLELQKSAASKPGIPENKRPPSEKPGEVQKVNKSHDLPPLNISPAKSRARTTSSSSDVSPTVAKMRKDDRRLSQDPIVHLKPLPSEIDVKSPTVPVAPDILAFCEQAATGAVSPVKHPSPTKPGSQSIKMKLGLRTPTKGEKTNNNNGEMSTENAMDKGAVKMSKKDEKPVVKEPESKETDASISLKKERPFDKHERRSKDHKATEKSERSDLKLKISLGGHGGSPNVKALKNEEAKKHTSSPTSLTTGDGLKLKIKLNSSEQSSSSDKEKHEASKAQEQQEQKPLKMVLKLPAGISSTPPPGEERERHRHHHKKHKHKDRHKEDRHSRKRAHSPGDGSHHSTSRHSLSSSSSSSSLHYPPSSKVPRSDTMHLNNTHGNGRHLEGGGGSNRNSPALHQVHQSIVLMDTLIKQKNMEIKRSMERQQREKKSLGNVPPLPPDDPYYPAPPPPPPPSDAPPLPPGPPPPQ